MITKNIESIGLEFEGGIDYYDLDRLKSWLRDKGWLNRFKVDTDGSVYVGNKEFSDAELKFWHSSMNKIFEFTDYLYNKCDFKTNESCGLHVHVKFKDCNKALSLMSFKPFWNDFLDVYVKFAKSWLSEKRKKKYLRRLDNGYCLAKYREKDVVEQIKGYYRCSSRYRAINLNSFKRFKTIEFRILPNQDDFEEFKVTITWFVKVIDKLFEKYKNVVKTLKVKSVDILQNEINFNKETYVVEVGKIKKVYEIKKFKFELVKV